MMRVFLDDKPLDQAGASLATAIRAAGDAAERAGRVVIEVKFNGAPVDGPTLDHPPTTPAADTDEVRFITTDPRALVATSLQDAADLLAGVRQAQRQAAAALHGAKYDDAMAGLSQSVEAWDTVRRVVDGSAALLRLDLSAVRTPDGTPGGTPRPVTESIAALAALLDRLRSALATQDWSALGDVLEFDLDEQAERWDTVLRSLAGFVRSGG